MTTREKVPFLLAIVLFTIGLNYVLFKLGHPQSLWFWCDIAKVCS